MSHLEKNRDDSGQRILDMIMHSFGTGVFGDLDYTGVRLLIVDSKMQGKVAKRLERLVQVVVNLLHLV
jgi:hypothetical protein